MYVFECECVLERANFGLKRKGRSDWDAAVAVVVVVSTPVAAMFFGKKFCFENSQSLSLLFRLSRSLGHFSSFVFSKVNKLF